MRFLRSPLLAGAALVLLCACSTASGPTASEQRAMGTPEIVYLQPGPDLMVLDSEVDVQDSLGCFSVAGMLGTLLCAGVQKAREAYRESKVEAKHASLAPYFDQIKSLDFHARTQAMFASAVADAPWLAGRPVHKQLWNVDESQYVRGKGGDTVIYIQPVYALDPYSNSFVVEVLVGIQRFDPAYPDGLHNFRKLEFSFSHQPMDLPSGLNHDQRHEALQEMASMDSAHAMQLWFADDAALLKADFAADLKQVQAGVRDMLGSRP
ncbi:MAG TPA: hypothetical protein VGM16_05020 [Gammaproteobacteria bacterium]|jgi:hypothetical protein